MIALCSSEFGDIVIFSPQTLQKPQVSYSLAASAKPSWYPFMLRSARVLFSCVINLDLYNLSASAATAFLYIFEFESSKLAAFSQASFQLSSSAAWIFISSLYRRVGIGYFSEFSRFLVGGISATLWIIIGHNLKDYRRFDGCIMVE